MSEPFRRGEVRCPGAGGPHRMACLEWGRPGAAQRLICVHGLTRCARDFDSLAAEMARCGFRVVCPDIAGRGDSDWLPNPADYAIPTYAGDMQAMMAQLGLTSVLWVGTSLGGLIGMTLAARPDSPVKKLVLNDVGPVLSAAALDRIGAYLGKWPRLPDMDAAEQYVRSVSATFGPHTDAEWRSLTEHVVRSNPDGTLRMHYDPAIAVPFNAELPHQDTEMWKTYDAIVCPTLVLRGEHSDLLTRETAAEMARRGPRAKIVEVAGVGHAPTLIREDQISIVRDFLLA